MGVSNGGSVGGFDGASVGAAVDATVVIPVRGPPGASPCDGVVAGFGGDL